MRRSLVALLVAALPAAAQNVVVGVLEHPHCKEADVRAVRPLFARANGQWRSLDKPPPALTEPADWHVVDARGSNSTLRTQKAPPVPQPSWTYARDFLLEPASDSTLPSLPNPEKLYSGWCDAPANRPVFLVTGRGTRRPTLIALPRANQAHDMAALLRGFNASSGATRLCLEYNDGKPISLAVGDLSVTESLQLPSGARLIALSLRRELTECKSERGGVDLPRWFVLGGGQPRFLGASLAFIAAADLDADGTIEYLFWYSGYNRDGYVLFDASFKNPARFLWSYH